MSVIKSINRRYGLLFLLFFISYGYFFQGGGWNQNIRVCFMRALIHEHTFIIDKYKEDALNPSFEFVNSGDWAYCNGHYYSEKSPGLDFLAIVPFAVSEIFFKKIFPSDVEKQVWLSVYICNLFTTVLYASLLNLLLFHVFHYFFKQSEINCLLLTIFFGFGTLFFSYSTTFYCHVPAAFFSFLSFVVALHIKHGEMPERKRLLAFLSGFSASTAVLIESSAVFSLSCIVLYLLSFKEGRSALFFFLIGCIPAGVVQCFYNAMCFNSPLTSSYLYSNDAIMFKVDGKLFGIPRPAKLMQMLFMPWRGLFITSPVLIMVLPGIVSLVKRRRMQAEMMLCAAITASIFSFVLCCHAWHGAAGAGPRHLLQLYPFIFLLAAPALSRFPKTFIVIGLASIVINLSITVVGNEIPMCVQNPLADVIYKNILKGRVSINPGPLSNFENYPNLMEIDRIENWQTNFNSFNLGELLFPHHILSIIPLMLFWVAWGWMWRKKSVNLCAFDILSLSF
jgi:hypothetical protein